MAVHKLLTFYNVDQIPDCLIQLPPVECGCFLRHLPSRPYTHTCSLALLARQVGQGSCTGTYAGVAAPTLPTKPLMVCVSCSSCMCPSDGGQVQLKAEVHSKDQVCVSHTVSPPCLGSNSGLC